jgi:hypothetical protein
MRVPPNSLVLGVPARVVRATTEEERQRIARTVASYLTLQERHRGGEFAAAPATSPRGIIAGREILAPQGSKNAVAATRQRVWRLARRMPT